jgi:hypothetical protein
LLYKLYKLKFSTNLIKLISSFLSQWKFSFVEGEMSVPREIQAGVPQGYVLSPTLYSMDINGTSRTPSVYLALFANDTCMYATDRKEGYILRKLQRSLSLTEMWCKWWNIKINEDKTQPIYSYNRQTTWGLSHIERWNIPLVNNVKYLNVIFDKRNTWRLRIEMTKAKAFRTFIRIYSLVKSDWLCANIKLTPTKH